MYPVLGFVGREAGGGLRASERPRQFVAACAQQGDWAAKDKDRAIGRLSPGQSSTSNRRLFLVFSSGSRCRAICGRGCVPRSAFSVTSHQRKPRNGSQIQTGRYEWPIKAAGVEDETVSRQRAGSTVTGKSSGINSNLKPEPFNGCRPTSPTT